MAAVQGTTLAQGGNGIVGPDSVNAQTVVAARSDYGNAYGAWARGVGALHIRPCVRLHATNEPTLR